jgi:predicted Zn-dependent protease with MMP-like domain
MIISEERFEELVAGALDRLPKKYRDLIEDVAVVIEDRSTSNRRNSFTLGRYHGVPRLIRQGQEPTLPDQIIFYRDDLAALVRTEPELIEQIEKTLWHEIGHHLGFSDPELRRLEQQRKKR